MEMIPTPYQKTTLHQQQKFRTGLPSGPYCSDDVAEGLVIRRIPYAIKRRYIQPNPHNSCLWLMYDIDRPTCIDEITDDLGCPPPSILCQNPENGHAHAFYGLHTEVHLNDDSSPKAIRFCGAVDIGLHHSIGGDPGFTGLITKNPLHPSWRTYYTRAEYDLADLADYVKLGAWADRRRRMEDVGLGRNCNIFNASRKWAYTAIREYTGNRAGWERVMLSRCEYYNAQLNNPLAFAEVHHIARSIAKWTWRHMSPAAFSASQAAKARKRAAAARAKREPQRQLALELLAAGMSKRAVAKEIGVGKSTVDRWGKS